MNKIKKTFEWNFSCVLFNQQNSCENMETTFRADDEQCFLSNFFLSTPIIYKNFVYDSAEHLFQAALCCEKRDRDKIRNTKSPKSAKILGRFLKKRSHCTDRKLLKAMYKVLKLKFDDNTLKTLLRETSNTQLIQLNYWHDTFWGICTCTQHKRFGKNWLGILLMKIRANSK